jgi:hypothetical protein
LYHHIYFSLSWSSKSNMKHIISFGIFGLQMYIGEKIDLVKGKMIEERNEKCTLVF